MIKQVDLWKYTKNFSEVFLLVECMEKLQGLTLWKVEKCEWAYTAVENEYTYVHPGIDRLSMHVGHLSNACLVLELTKKSEED